MTAPRLETTVAAKALKTEVLSKPSISFLEVYDELNAVIWELQACDYLGRNVLLGDISDEARAMRWSAELLFWSAHSKAKALLDRVNDNLGGKN